MTHPFTLSIGLFLALACSVSKAQDVRAEADYLIGPDISERTACQLALGKAKTQAIARIVGEAVSSEEQQICNDVPSNPTASRCEFYRFAWSLTAGQIKILSTPQETVGLKGNTRVCNIQFDAKVIVPSKKPDPNFKVGANITQNVYRAGDDFSLDIESTMPTYIAVFSWLPHEGNRVHRINKPDAKSAPESEYLAKNPNGKIGMNYRLVASWSDAYSDAKRLYDEWLIVVATKAPRKWLNLYEFEAFQEQIWGIPMDELSVAKRPYQIAK